MIQIMMSQTEKDSISILKGHVFKEGIVTKKH